MYDMTKIRYIIGLKQKYGQYINDLKNVKVNHYTNEKFPFERICCNLFSI